MLFNSYIFILVFLPLSLAGYYICSQLGRRRAAMAWLVACSLVYYMWWEPKYLLLLGTSVLVNFTVGTYLGLVRPYRARRALLIGGTTFNLALLGYFKYTNFFLQTFSDLTGIDYNISAIVLPLGISFFTFQQIAYLVDAYRGYTREYNFIDYTLFVTFFPQLIAGPIVHHKEMLPQFSHPDAGKMKPDVFSAGLTMFAIGLFKKVMIADTMATYATPIFNTALAGHDPTLAEAWIGALAYTMQIYFDFSGYSDMAIGIAGMFGIRLPANFNSPYKSKNIIEFWRSWHLTLSRFLRDYLYIPLGGNRLGPMRRYFNLMTTMLLGGMWHGVGWTFIAWGGLHGIYLIINNIWIQYRGAAVRRGTRSITAGRLESAFGWALTFLAVIIAWVFFRAPTFDAAGRMLGSMFMLNNFSLESQVSRLGALMWMLTLIPMVILMPNSQQIMRLTHPVLDIRHREMMRNVLKPLKRLRWFPNTRWALLVATMLVLALLNLAKPSEFIYFQF